MTTSADRYAAAEKARLERAANNPNLSAFERDHARQELTRKRQPREWIDPDAVCRFCTLSIREHTNPARPWNKGGEGNPLSPRWDAGSTLCPVVRDVSRMGDPTRGERSQWRYFRMPNEDECAKWRASNLAGAVEPKTSAERKREAKRREEATRLEVRVAELRAAQDSP